MVKTRRILRFLLALGLVLGASAAQAQTYVQTPCREYSEELYQGSQHLTGYGVACLQADGRWHVVSNDGTTGYNPSGQILLGRQIVQPTQQVIVRQPTYYPRWQPAYEAYPYYYGPGSNLIVSGSPYHSSNVYFSYGVGTAWPLGWGHGWDRHHGRYNDWDRHRGRDNRDRHDGRHGRDHR